MDSNGVLSGGSTQEVTPKLAQNHEVAENDGRTYVYLFSEYAVYKECIDLVVDMWAIGDRQENIHPLFHH